MTKELKRQKRDSETKNPFMEDVKPPRAEESEILKTMKVPESTHQKLSALAKIKNKKLYQMVDALAEEFINSLDEKERTIIDFMLNNDK